MRGEKATKPCDACGEPTTKLLSQARGKGWFCSVSCSVTKQWGKGLTARATPNPLRGQRDTRPCAACGEPVTRYLSQRTAARIWTCSNTCQASYYTRKRMSEGTQYLPTKPRRGETNPCEVCEAPVYRNKSQAAKGEGRYCSQACHNVAQTKPPTIKSCPICGKEMRLKPSQAQIQYCSRACLTSSRIKRPLDRMHNGRPAKLDSKGYVMLWEPTHPNKSLKGWQLEHRLVAEASLGRYLTSEEQVDHINEIKGDNRPENLQVLSAADHSKKTVKDLWGGISAQRDDLAEYRRLYGPLPGKE